MEDRRPVEIDPALDQRYPSVSDLETAALRRLPRFMADYLRCGMGEGGGLRRNREALDAVELLPRYLGGVEEVSTGTRLLDTDYAVPFGVAPVGLGSLAWPDAPVHLARAARRHELPFVTSTFSFTSLETIRQEAGEVAWFQLYRPNQPDVEEDLLARAERCGYTCLVVTVDVPAGTRRNHDIRNGFSLPPRFDARTLWDLATHPVWSLAVALETARRRFPRFENFEPYVPPGLDGVETLRFQSELTRGPIDTAVFSRLRKLWPGKLIVKGVLSAEDARGYQALGADALVVSNHGGRQLEAAPSPVQVLPAIRSAVGEDYPLLADGGVRSGLDVCRMLAVGADFVLLGRAFYYAVAALGARGADHVMALLRAELVATLAQLGCPDLDTLPQRRLSDSPPAAAPAPASAPGSGRTRR